MGLRIAEFFKRKLLKIKKDQIQNVCLVGLFGLMYLCFVAESMVFQSIVLLLLGVYALWNFSKTRKIYFQPYMIFFLALFLIRLLYWLGSNQPFSAIEQSLSFVFLPLIFLFLKLSPEQWKWIQRCVICVLLLAIIYMFLGFYESVVKTGNLMDALKNAKGYYHLFLKAPFFYHPSFFSIILAPVMLIAMDTFFKEKKTLWKSIYVIFVVCAYVAVYLSGSRIGGVVFTALVLLVVLYYYPKFTTGLKLLLLAGVLFFAGLYLCSDIQYIEDPIRSELTEFGIQKIKEAPWNGYGLKAQQSFFNDSGNLATFQCQNIVHFNHFHNVFIDEVFQFGWIGLLILGVLLLYILDLGLKTRDIYLLSFMVIYIPFFITESPFNALKGIMPMMLWICLIMNTHYMRKKDIQKS